MEFKQVVRFPRSTTGKDDICYELDQFKLITKEKNCDSCRVHIVTDRFLSKKFQRHVMKDNRDFPMGIYPYVLIIDTSLCNLRCRGCYSSKYWKPEKETNPVIISPEVLVNQFICKIKKLGDDKLIKNRRIGEKVKRPFSRLRISGGEPLYNLKGDSVNFWISFFKLLDKQIEILLLDRKLNLKSEKEWVTMSINEREEAFPVFLESDSKKIRIRFDTNGLLFKNKEFTKSFIGAIYNLELHCIKIDLTFSLKGTNSFEVDWFINNDSNFDNSKIYIEESIEEHPQWASIMNIVEIINSCEQKITLSKKTDNLISESYYNPCGDVSLTLERGIMNNPNERIYLYNKNSLKWDEFAQKLKEKGFLLSETENCIYLGQYPLAIAWRYINAGNYELRLKCPFHSENPFLSYSKNEKSRTYSLRHRQIKGYSDKNLIHFSNRLKIQNQKQGTKCIYSDIACEYWIEVLP